MPNVAPSDKPELESLVVRLGDFSCGVRVGLPVESDGDVEITLLGDMLLVGAAELILGATDGRMEGIVLGATESVGTLDGNIVEGLILGAAEGKIVGVADGFVLGSKDGRMDGRLLGAVESSFRTTLLDGNVEGLMLLLGAAEIELVAVVGTWDGMLEGREEGAGSVKQDVKLTRQRLSSAHQELIK
eukprot:scaffold1878_cov104-Cylindrotheca_fusiformis.AAC.3